MDYSEDFRLVQTTLNHCNEYVKKFEKIYSYGGFEIYVNEIALRLRNIFRSRGYNNLESDQLRKINFLLMLNTDCCYKYDLSEDFKICHLLNNFAQLSKCLYSNLVWNLKLEKYYYEALKYAPSWFILQFLDETVDSLRFSKSFDVIEQVKELVACIYTNICRMDYRYSSKSDQQFDQKIILSRFTDSVTSLLRNYNTPLTEESITKSKRRIREYNGHSLNFQLKLVLECLKMFQNKPPFMLKEELQIYKINQNREPEVNNFSEVYSSIVNETLESINVILLNTLQNTILNITLEDFMYWVEIDIDDLSIQDTDLKRDNLQKLIGEQAYELIEMIKTISKLEHNVVNQLSTISIKPKSLADVAKEANIGTILDRIETSHSRDIWLQELLNRQDTLYFNTECLQTIIENAEILEINHLLKMIKDCQNFSMDDEDEDLMKIIFFKGGSRLCPENVSVLVEEMIRMLGSDYNILDDTELAYESEMRNFINKISEDNIEEEKAVMWRLILKYPQKFYEMLLAHADVNQNEMTILRVIETTSSIASSFIKQFLTKNISYDYKKTSHHLLLAGIFRLEILERKEFIKYIMMNNFTKCISISDLNTLLVYLQVLKTISNNLKISDLLPPLMIQLAQIIDKFRWDMMTYSSLREEVVDITIMNIQQLIKIILISGTKNDKVWIMSKINNMKVLTRFYFQKLLLEKGEAIVPFDEFLHPNKFENEPRTKITTFLCETIVRCTSKECKKLMTNETLQKFYTEAITIVATIAKKSNLQAPNECMKKCVKDYSKILTEIIIPNNQRETLLKDIINLIKQFPSSIYDDLTILFLEALNLLKSCENFTNKICELEDCELKRILLE